MTQHRKSPRLPSYDYAQPGGYFLTVCAHNRACIFGDVVDGTMVLNDVGQIVQHCWDDLPNHFAHVELDAFVVMPNHVHGIIVLTDGVGAGLKPAPTSMKRHTLSEIVRAFKTFSSRRVNQLRQTPGTPVWQCNYYNHVIRTENDLSAIREYIVNNPLK